MLRLLARSRCPEARRQASAVAVKARQRLKAVGSAEKRYVNVTGGPRGADTFNIVNAELVLAGFGELLGAHVPGPLIQATEGSVTTHIRPTPRTPHCTRRSMRRIAWPMGSQFCTGGPMAKALPLSTGMIEIPNSI